MVRATVTSQTTPGAGEVERYTAVDLEPGDTTPGVYPMYFEHAALQAAADGAGWVAQRDRIEAWDDADAARVASATYDAARAFLELGIEPDTGTPRSDFRPGELTIDLGDDRWTFTSATAPTAAWNIVRAARMVRADAPS